MNRLTKDLIAGKSVRSVIESALTYHNDTVDFAFNVLGRGSIEGSMFIITKSGEIYSETKSDGFFRRSDMSMDRLKDHIYNMLSEGFTLEPVKDKKTIARLNKALSNYTE